MSLAIILSQNTEMHIVATNMKKSSLCLLGFLAAASSAFCATPAVDVTVSTSSGKLVYKGKTGESGTFATAKLEPGSYVVQFNSKAAPKGQFTLVVSAGKKKVSADGVLGEKLAAGGVAMKVDVGSGLNITGQIADAAQLASKTKIINGKRYVWVKGGETGSNIGGRWVEEGSPDARNVTRMSSDAINRIQEHGDTHQEGFPTGR